MHSLILDSFAQADSQFVYRESIKVFGWGWSSKWWWWGIKYVGGPPQTFRWNVTLRYSGSLSSRHSEHFKGSELNTVMHQPVVFNSRYALTTTESVSPQRIFHVFPRQSPKFLSCSFMVLQRAALTHSPPPWFFLNQGYGLYSQKRQKQETGGGAVWIWHNSSSQTQKRPTDRTDRAQNPTSARSCPPGWGGRNPFCFLPQDVHIKRTIRGVQLCY